jgi:sec-independent protein translocase protein TatC
LPKGQVQKLIYTAPHEAFFTYLQVAFIGGVLLAIPVILFQLWRFIAPGLYSDEKRYVIPIAFVSTVFFLGGALFGYYLVFPAAFHFFTSFANEFISPMITTKAYLSFCLRLLLGFGVVFELPVFVFFLARMGMVTAAFLRKQRRYAIILCFVVAMLITPSPDVFSQLMMAGPLLVLFELSVWIAHFFGRERTAERDAEVSEENNQSDSSD